MGKDMKAVVFLKIQKLPAHVHGPKVTRNQTWDLTLELELASMVFVTSKKPRTVAGGGQRLRTLGRFLPMSPQSRITLSLLGTAPYSWPYSGFMEKWP